MKSQSQVKSVSQMEKKIAFYLYDLWISKGLHRVLKRSLPSYVTKLILDKDFDGCTNTDDLMSVLSKFSNMFMIKGESILILNKTSPVTDDDVEKKILEVLENYVMRKKKVTITELSAFGSNVAADLFGLENAVNYSKASKIRSLAFDHPQILKIDRFNDVTLINSSPVSFSDKNLANLFLDQSIFQRAEKEAEIELEILDFLRELVSCSLEISLKELSEHGPRLVNHFGEKKAGKYERPSSIENLIVGYPEIFLVDRNGKVLVNSGLLSEKGSKLEAGIPNVETKDTAWSENSKDDHFNAVEVEVFDVESLERTNIAEELMKLTEFEIEKSKQIVSLYLPKKVSESKWSQVHVMDDFLVKLHNTLDTNSSRKFSSRSSGSRLDLFLIYFMEFHIRRAGGRLKLWQVNRLILQAATFKEGFEILKMHTINTIFLQLFNSLYPFSSLAYNDTTKELVCNSDGFEASLLEEPKGKASGEMKALKPIEIRPDGSAYYVTKNSTMELKAENVLVPEGMERVTSMEIAFSSGEIVYCRAKMVDQSWIADVVIKLSWLPKLMGNASTREAVIKSGIFNGLSSLIGERGTIAFTEERNDAQIEWNRQTCDFNLMKIKISFDQKNLLNSMDDGDLVRFDASWNYLEGNWIADHIEIEKESQNSFDIPLATDLSNQSNDDLKKSTNEESKFLKMFGTVAEEYPEDNEEISKAKRDETIGKDGKRSESPGIVDLVGNSDANLRNNQQHYEPGRKSTNLKVSAQPFQPQPSITNMTTPQQSNSPSIELIQNPSIGSSSLVENGSLVVYHVTDYSPPCNQASVHHFYYPQQINFLTYHINTPNFDFVLQNPNQQMYYDLFRPPFPAVPEFQLQVSKHVPTHHFSFPPPSLPVLIQPPTFSPHQAPALNIPVPPTHNNGQPVPVPTVVQNNQVPTGKYSLPPPLTFPPPPLPDVNQPPTFSLQQAPFSLQQAPALNICQPVSSSQHGGQQDGVPSEIKTPIPVPNKELFQSTVCTSSFKSTFPSIPRHRPKPKKRGFWSPKYFGKGARQIESTIDGGGSDNVKKSASEDSVLKSSPVETAKGPSQGVRILVRPNDEIRSDAASKSTSKDSVSKTKDDEKGSGQATKKESPKNGWSDDAIKRALKYQKDKVSKSSPVETAKGPSQGMRILVRPKDEIRSDDDSKRASTYLKDCLLTEDAEKESGQATKKELPKDVGFDDASKSASKDSVSKTEDAEKGSGQATKKETSKNGWSDDAIKRSLKYQKDRVSKTEEVAKGYFSQATQKELTKGTDGDTSDPLTILPSRSDDVSKSALKDSLLKTVEAEKGSGQTAEKELPQNGWSVDARKRASKDVVSKTEDAEVYGQATKASTTRVETQSDDVQGTDGNQLHLTSPITSPEKINTGTPSTMVTPISQTEEAGLKAAIYFALIFFTGLLVCEILYLF